MREDVQSIEGVKSVASLQLKKYDANLYDDVRAETASIILGLNSE